MTHPSSPTYEIWRPGNGRTSRPEAWQPVTPMECLGLMQEVFRRDMGKLADRWPDEPINAAAVWWVYLHRWESIDLGKLRVRVRSGAEVTHHG